MTQVIIKSKLIIAILSCIFYQCTTTKNQISIADQKAFLEKDTIGQVEIWDVILAREVCSKSSPSFCWDGIEQNFRLVPSMIKWEEGKSIESLYRNSYITFAVGEASNTLEKKEIDYISLGKEYDEFEKKFIDSKKITVKTNLKKGFQKQLNLKDDFNGDFDFMLYNAKIKVVYGGLKSIVLPNFDFKKSEDLLYEPVTCNTFFLCEILSISPIGNK